MIHFIKKLIAFFALSLGLVVTAQAAEDSDYFPPQKVVYHINYQDPQMQLNALQNIQNHIEAVGKTKLDLVVVLHGPGLSLLLKPEALKRVKLRQAHATKEVQKDVARLKKLGVKFKVCLNTMDRNNINPKTDLFDVHEEDIVPSGISELARLQGMGYVYIKP